MELEQLRGEIDRINDDILNSFIERMKVSGQIADLKTAKGMEILDPARERAVLAKISGKAGPEYASYARILFATLFELSRSVQANKSSMNSALAERIGNALEETDKIFPKEAVVACQGVEGANSQIACDKIFQFANIMYVRSFDAVFNAVEKGLCRYGILPIENSSHGSVSTVYDLMTRHNFHIVRSMKLLVRHCLLARRGVKLEDVREIYSHEQALGQCSKFLAQLPGVRIISVENTAEAAKMIAESGRTDIAAIASEECAHLYGLRVLENNIQDTDNNYTRFIVISKKLEIYPGAEKISIMFSVNNTPGALQRMIARFSSLSLNMTKLESRPIAGTDFQYRFYVDVDASVYDPDVVNLLSEMENGIEGFVFLGAYNEI